MTSIGTFRYSPTVNGSHIRRDGGSTLWWLIIDCDRELGRYLRHLYTLATYHTRKIQSPLWETHISVIRGEEPLDMTHWRRFDGQSVEFEYEFTVHETDGYLWTPVRCDIALDHRRQLDLPREPQPPLHMTIGNLKHEDGLE